MTCPYDTRLHSFAPAGWKFGSAPGPFSPLPASDPLAVASWRHLHLAMSFTLLLALVPLFAAPAAPQQTDELVVGELGQRLDDFLLRLEGLGFAGVVGVEDGGKPILVKGYGQADREAGRAVTPDTVFDLGSITKQFTAAAILALQDEGKLSAQDLLSKHLPGVPADKAGLTLRHLLTHTSGLVDPPRGDHDLTATADWIREWALAQPLEHAPGAGYAYRNVNFSLLGLVIERVSGEGYEAFLARRLFARAGMTRTGYLLPRFREDELAVGYRDGERWGTTLGRPFLADGPAWTLRANGGIHSTVGDVLRWHHALLDDTVLSSAARAELVTPVADEGGGTFYAYGWSIGKTPSGGRLVAHNGGNGVYFADLLRAVDEGRCVFVATGVGSRFEGDLAYDLLAILYGREARQLPATLPRDRAWLERYAGRFPLDEGAALVLENHGDRLALVGEGELTLELLGGETALPLLETARKLATEVCAGRDDALLASYAGFQTPDAIRAELAAARTRWQTTLGTFRTLAQPALRTGRPTRIAFELVHERGSAWLTLHFGPAGRVVGFECLDSAPFTGLTRLELFPVSPTEFRTYDERAEATHGVGFELDATGRAQALVLGGITLPRE